MSRNPCAEIPLVIDHNVRMMNCMIDFLTKLGFIKPLEYTFWGTGLAVQSSNTFTIDGTNMGELTSSSSNTIHISGLPLGTHTIKLG